MTAATDLARASEALAEAEESRDHLIRYASAHVAALRAAAAVLAVRAKPAASRRPVQRNVWVLLAKVAPELGEWAAFFAAGAPKRAAAEAESQSSRTSVAWVKSEGVECV